MANTGKNMYDLRLSNRVAILDLLYASGGLSRKQIAAKLNLTPPAISHIVSDLLSEGILVEAQKVEGSSRMGRREILLRIDLSRFKVLCAFIPTRKVKISCIDLAGHVDYSRELDCDPQLSGVDMLHAVAEEMLAYVNTLPEDTRHCIIGAGLGIKGICDDTNGVSLQSFGLWEDGLSVASILSERLSLKVLAMNDIRCVANAEKLFNHSDDVHSMLLVKLGPLVGGSFVQDGRLFKGSRYQAMELGHFVIDPLGCVCRCGKRGCLETIIGFDVIASHLRIQYSAQRLPLLYKLTGGDKTAITMQHIMESFDQGERIVCDMLDSALERFALMLVDAVGLVDPEKVILYGFPFESERFVALLQRKVARVSCGTVKTPIAKSSLNLQLDDLGCASIIIEDFIQCGGIYTPMGGVNGK